MYYLQCVSTTPVYKKKGLKNVCVRYIYEGELITFVEASKMLPDVPSADKFLGQPYARIGNFKLVNMNQHHTTIMSGHRFVMVGVDLDYTPGKCWVERA